MAYGLELHLDRRPRRPSGACAGRSPGRVRPSPGPANGRTLSLVRFDPATGHPGPVCRGTESVSVTPQTEQHIAHLFNEMAAEYDQLKDE